MYVGGRPVELWEIDHSWNQPTVRPALRSALQALSPLIRDGQRTVIDTLRFANRFDALNSKVDTQGRLDLGVDLGDFRLEFAHRPRYLVDPPLSC